MQQQQQQHSQYRISLAEQASGLLISQQKAVFAFIFFGYSDILSLCDQHPEAMPC